MSKLYVSEHTQFMREWLEKHPEQRAEKFNGRKLWWDLGSDNSEWHCSSEIDDKWLPLDCRG